ncbi:hypothetical protein Aab01nite_36680 [Paractinoplanes abujensis]|uniref:Uncharacterized protein n=1 Tax=Paractinoplanes abujensis TaxID=882441 RepID=A0A7W7CU26_9ACTN|nr:hypothetical protein [Actinoplanes abujensis]MBB4694710.1 hypothetical protein [Actinoplanes abujensis]GID20078.1 hypothetical protein Aab01nite_36680 [Actinoplanes abujensis]
MTYDLDAPVVRRRCATALAAHPARGRFVALAVGPADPLADVARTVERQALGHDATALAFENSPYESQSLFLLVLDRDTGLPAGAGRVVEGGGRALDDAPARIGRDLSAIVDAHGLHDGGKIWDLATLVVLDDDAGPLLHRTLLQAGHRAGVRHVVALLDDRTHRDLTLLGVPFTALAGAEPAQRAVYVSFAEVEPAIVAQARRLSRPVGPFAGEIRARGLRRLLTRRTAARVCDQVATGAGLNEHIQMPGLERRRYRSLKTKR